MSSFEYPHTPATDFVETLHGRQVADPYRWLEDTGDQRVQDWIDSQNTVTERWLSQSGQRTAIRDRLRALWDFPRLSVPSRHGKHWFQMRNTGLQDQGVLWVADAADAQGRVLLDPNTLSDDGTAALTAMTATDDGRLLAYGLSERGSDWRVWRVRDVLTGEDLPDEVRWSKFTSAAWHPDGSGFWYGLYEPPADDAAYQEATRGQRLAFHRLATSQAEDEIVFEIPDETDWIFQPQVTEDGRWLVVSLWRGTDRRSRVWVADLEGDGVLRPLLDDFDAHYSLVGNDAATLYLHTDLDAPRGRVVSIAADSAANVDATDPRGTAGAGGATEGSPTAGETRAEGARGVGSSEALVEVVAQRDETLQEATIVGGEIVTAWLSDAASVLRRYGLDGADKGVIALPGIGTVGAPTGRQADDAAYFAYSSFTEPTSIYRLDVSSGHTSLLQSPMLDADPSRLVTEQVFATSADGTRVPMFLVHRTDVDASTPRPTLLWGYGGFGIPVTPGFNVAWYVWVERGGVLAVANLRGGGEYGDEWHDDGRLGNKQHVFDDAIACGQWLVDNGWTDTDHLAVKGRSNGGLLAGACLTQRPDLFGAVVAEVGVLDMLRFHMSTIGWAWKSDYGDPDDPAAFANLLAYSPYHNVEPGTTYPATLVTTGDHDDRVVPAHSFKFAARLQAAQAGDAPVLLRVDRSGGHGMGKPTAKVIEERADVLAFLDRVLDGGGHADGRD